MIRISVSVEIRVLVNSTTEKGKTFKIVSLRTIQTFTTEKRLIHRRRMREWPIEFGDQGQSRAINF